MIVSTKPEFAAEHVESFHHCIWYFSSLKYETKKNKDEKITDDTRIVQADLST